MFTIEQVKSRTVTQLHSSLEKRIRVYARGGFTVCMILMDMEFENITDELDLVTVNTLSTREDIAEIERGIRWVEVQ